MKNRVYALNGEAKDQETIVRLRSWIEDEVRDKGVDFDHTNISMDYNADKGSFSYTITFFKEGASLSGV